MNLTPLTEEQRQLAEQFIPLARSLAKSYKALFPRYRDEFDSVCLFALVAAARNYDPSLGIKFATFARFRINGELFNVRNMITPRGYKQEPEVAPKTIELSRIPADYLETSMGSAANHETAVDAIDAVEGRLKRLPRKQSEVCRLKYIHGKSQAEISRMIGCSQAEVARCHNLALARLSGGGQARWKRKSRRKGADLSAAPAA